MTTVRKGTQTKKSNHTIDVSPSIDPPTQRTDTAIKPRQLHLPAYRPLRFKRIKHPVRLPNVWQLTAQTARTLWCERRRFLWLLVIYVLLALLFVKGFNVSADVAGLKQQLHVGAGGASSAVLTGVNVMTSLLSSSASSGSDSAGVYQLCLGLLVSLAAIWLLRQTAASQPTTVKEAFYKGMYPLVPFLLVLCVIILELLPLLLGGSIYSFIVTNGLAVGAGEQLLFGAIFTALACLSLYFICSSIFALYIVTLPDMTPRLALRNAGQLVRYRRGAVLARLLYLPLALMILIGVIVVPLIIFWPVSAPLMLFVLSSAALLVIHTYIYTMYKALLT